MDRVALKLRLSPGVIARLKKLHPSYGEVSRVIEELLEVYVKTKEGNPTMGSATVYEKVVKSY